MNIRVDANTTQLDCPDCARTAEKEIKAIEGVSGARIDFLNGRIHYSFDQTKIDNDTLKQKIEGLGHFKFIEQSAAASATFPFSKKLLYLTLISLVLAAAAVTTHLLSGDAKVVGALYLAATLVGGWDIITKAFIGLRHKRVDMNMLMSIAVAGALAIGEFQEAVAVVLLFSLANLLESYSLWRLSKNLTHLSSFVAGEALLKRENGIEAVSPEILRPDDIIVIKEGSKIPVDGVVMAGQSFVDLSFLTGESAPEGVAPGLRVYAGSTNLDGYLEVKVSSSVKDSRIGKILQLVGEAAERRGKIERVVDKFARVYTPIVVGLAFLVAVIPPLLFQAPFAVWFYKSLVFLVISCPCALVISTPVAITTALSRASRLKAFMKGGDALERLANAKTIAFDKTGTLTEGTLSLEKIVTMNGIDEAAALKIAASLEQVSHHPVAHAITRAAEKSSVQPYNVKNLRSIPGVGVEGTIDETSYRFGSGQILKNSGLEQIEKSEGSYLVAGDKVLAQFKFKDTLRVETTAAISSLREQGITQMGILSGDRQEIVEELAKELRLDFGVGQLQPAQKLERIKSLGDGTAMVGDGINDIVALAGSDISIAISRWGADTPSQHADVVLFGNNIENLPRLFALGKETIRTIRENIAFAFAIKVIFLGLAVAGYASIWMAVIADMGASLAVIFNSLRLLKR